MNFEVNRENASSLVIGLKNDPPALYQVILHNDDYTPMEFVVAMLEAVFGMDRRKAIEVMFKAHKEDKALCGCYTREIAETIIIKTREYAKRRECPLVCSMEAMG